MITAEQCILDSLISPVRTINGRVESYAGSALSQTFKKTDNLKSFSVERTGESNKFFGFGIGQKLKVELVDKNREINIDKSHTLEVALGSGCDYVYPYPVFYVEEVVRNENTNELTIEAYDALYKANQHKVSDLNVAAPYSLKTFTLACASLLGLPLKIDIPEGDNCFEIMFNEGANFNGTESLREALDDIAEATQTIYYINNNWELVFKRLRDAVDLEISKTDYFTLNSKTSATIAGVAHTTQLGDNIIADSGNPGIVCQVRDNAFWSNRADLSELVENALAAVNGLTMYQYDLSWRGNFLLEIGDKVALTTKDDETIHAYILNDTITYGGGLKQTGSWSFEESSKPDATPSTLGEAITQTFAKVDKVNKQIELVVSDVNNNANEISSLQMTANSINATVSSLQQSSNEVKDEVNQLSSKVEAQITSEDVSFLITKELANGAQRVETTTGFTFDETGLTVSKSNSEMTTQITEDGMKIYRNEDEVLTVDNVGVKAKNLHATTYLIVGTNSRFEDYGNRTGCFWIGG